MDEVQQALDEPNRAEEQNASESAAIRDEVASLAAKLEKAQKTWWQKMFSTPES